MAISTDSPITPRLRIAISGGGPAGLAAAIALLEKPGFEVTIYEQATELREVGAGLRVGYNSWRVLELLGVADKVKGHIKVDHQHRDGVTGEVLYTYPPYEGDWKYHDTRVRRTVLQDALKSRVPSHIIQLKKRLVDLVQQPGGGVVLLFQDGTSAYADLVIGADGIRSAVRRATFPDHETTYNGTTIWRCLIPLDSVDNLSITKYTAFHHGPKRMFKCSVVSTQEEIDAGKGLWEMTLRSYEDPAQAKGMKYSWGIPATNERVASHFTEFSSEIREAIDKVPEGTWKEFSAFSGPRLQQVIADGNTAIIGDASHPLLGAFGTGAGFAMEDGWLLAQILELSINQHKNDTSRALRESLTMFDKIRSPYYHRIYDVLDAKPQDGKVDYAAWSPTPGGPLNWIYFHDVEEDWKQIQKGFRAVA
ncbi:salicylate hydroxylase [Diaporthe sp. PMI_573]|nr:salicylate hydroxylase [Diaporthaceae sp. PMI_573]